MNSDYIDFEKKSEGYKLIKKIFDLSYIKKECLTKNIYNNEYNKTLFELSSELIKDFMLNGGINYSKILNYSKFMNRRLVKEPGTDKLIIQLAAVEFVIVRAYTTKSFEQLASTNSGINSVFKQHEKYRDISLLKRLTDSFILNVIELEKILFLLNTKRSFDQLINESFFSNIKNKIKGFYYGNNDFNDILKIFFSDNSSEEKLRIVKKFESDINTMFEEYILLKNANVKLSPKEIMVSVIGIFGRRILIGRPGFSRELYDSILNEEFYKNWNNYFSHLEAISVIYAEFIGVDTFNILVDDVI